MPKIIYIDMCADLFHAGHVNALKQCKEMGDILIVGIHSDKTIKSYKRDPIINMNDRIKVVESCKYVDMVISNAPLNITNEFINKYNIDIVCIPDNRTNEEKKMMFSINEDKLKTITYTLHISTTDIINRIKNSNT